MATTRRSFLKRAGAAVAAGAGLVLGVNAAKGAETPDPEPMHVTFELRQPTDEAFDRLRVAEPQHLFESGGHIFVPDRGNGRRFSTDGVDYAKLRAAIEASA